MKCLLKDGKLRIWSHLLKKSLMESFIFCAVFKDFNMSYHPQQNKNFISNLKVAVAVAV